MKTFPAVLCIILAVIIFSSTTLLAQDSSKVHSLEKGAWALQFELYGGFLTFQIQDYLGTTFSGKYHISDKRALRIGVDIGGNSTDFSTNSDNETSNYTRITRSDGLSSTHNFQTVVQHLWYVRENNGIHLYTGLGPMIDIDYRKLDQDDYNIYLGDPDLSDENRTKLIRDTSYYLGLSGSIGIEYFVKSNIGLSFEFQSNAGYRYSIQKYENAIQKKDEFEEKIGNQSDTRSHQFSYHSNRVKVGLSIYF